MNRFAKLSGKFHATYDAEGNLLPMVELRLVTLQVEGVYDSATGQIEQRSKAKTTSFVATVEEMRELAEQLRQVAVQGESKLTLAVSGNGGAA